MKKLFVALVLVLSPILMTASADDSAQLKYIEKYAPIAVSEMKRTGVPASITLAQGLLESGSGRSSLAVRGNNHFGIKCHNDWQGRTMYHDDDARGECFRVYDDAGESFRDHSDFLRFRDRYKFLFDLKPTDYKGWAYGLKKAGYATDPSYAEKLIRNIENFQLYRYDATVPEEEIPETPIVIEQKTTVVSVRRIKEELNFSLKRQVYENNGVPFVYSMAGETYESLAASFGLFKKEILQFNDAAGLSGALAEGTRVYLQPKKSQGAKGLDKYIVDDDCESLRDISQRFAVKMSSIRKMNGLPESYVVKEGDMLKLRK